MSYQTFFMFAAGLKEPICCPPGTLAGIAAHVARVEEALALKREQYLTNPVHWSSRDRFEGVEDEVLCETVLEHNNWIRKLYDDIGKWQKTPVPDGDVMTPETAQGFWHALEFLEVPPERWTKEYYRNRMEHLYEVMRGRPNEGVSIDDTKPLTQQQAAAVIGLFAHYLDVADLRLDVPESPGRGFNGFDYLASSSDCGYDWCAGDHGEGCFKAIHPDHIGECRRKKCPLREEREDKDDEE